VARLASGDDAERVAQELRPVIEGLGQQERPVVAWLLRDLSRAADGETRSRVREILDETGAVELAERGTRRWMPWRRALACEVLGSMGAERSVPVLVERLGDRRGEVRATAARALGAIGSPAAAAPPTAIFLERRDVPTGWRGGDRQVRGVQRPQRREVLLPELIQALAVDEILQSVLPEITHSDPVDEPARRLGEDDLTTVSGRGDAGRAVDVHPDVALVGHDRLARVEPHAHADRPRRQCFPGLVRRRHRVGCSGEHDEECVALRVHLDPCVSRERVPQRPPVLS
jgi:hypothetical protein